GGGGRVRRGGGGGGGGGWGPLWWGAAGTRPDLPLRAMRRGRRGTARAAAGAGVSARTRNPTPGRRGGQEERVMDLTKIAQLVSRALGAGRDLLAAHRELGQRHARLLEERQARAVAPATPAELLAAIAAEVDRRAAAVAAELQPQLLSLLGYDISTDLTLLARPPRWPARLANALDFDALCFLVGDQVKRALGALV